MKIYLAKYVLPIAQAPLQDGALLIDHDRIRECGPAKDLLEKYPEATRVDLGESVLLPGLVNAHCHLELSFSPPYDLAANASPSGEPNFVQWLIRVSKYQDTLKSSEKRSAMQEGLKNLRESGTTTVGDLTTYEGALTCYQESGLRVVTYPEVMNLHRKISQERFESALAYADEVIAKDLPKIRVGLAPYAPYTLSKNLLKIFYQHLKQLQVPVQIHTSESFAEMEFFYDSKGDIANILFPYIGWGETLPPPYQKTPIQYLNSIDFLEIKPALVGCVHLGPTDLAMIARSGSSVIYCPRAHSTLQLGKSPVRKILAHKIPAALGSESIACNSSLSLWEEMRAALKLNEQDPQPLTAEEVLTMATCGGAKALGLEKEIGSLEKGKFADFIVLKNPGGTSLENVVQQVVQRGNPEQIIKKVIAGEEIL